MSSFFVYLEFKFSVFNSLNILYFIDSNHSIGGVSLVVFVIDQVGTFVQNLVIPFLPTCQQLMRHLFQVSFHLTYSFFSTLGTIHFTGIIKFYLFFWIYYMIKYFEIYLFIVKVYLNYNYIYIRYQHFNILYNKLDKWEFRKTRNNNHKK